MNGSLDLLLWLVFVAFGVAIAVDSTTTQVPSRWGIFILVVAVVLAGPVWHLTVAPLERPVETQKENAEAEKVTLSRDYGHSTPDMRTIYWQKRQPKTCHYRLSRTEQRWIARTDAQPRDETCGEWPDLRL